MYQYNHFFQDRDKSQKIKRSLSNQSFNNDTGSDLSWSGNPISRTQSLNESNNKILSEINFTTFNIRLDKYDEIIKQINGPLNNFEKFIFVDEVKLKLKEEEDPFTHIPFETIEVLENYSNNLRKLKVLEITSYKLTTLPSDISNLSTLVELNLSNNLLETIPSSIFLLVNMEKLNLNNNKLQNISSEFGKLKQLKKLYLLNNLLIDLPYELKNLDKTDINLFFERSEIKNDEINNNNAVLKSKIIEFSKRTNSVGINNMSKESLNNLIMKYCDQNGHRPIELLLVVLGGKDEKKLSLDYIQKLCDSHERKYDDVDNNINLNSSNFSLSLRKVNDTNLKGSVSSPIFKSDRSRSVSSGLSGKSDGNLSPNKSFKGVSTPPLQLDKSSPTSSSNRLPYSNCFTSPPSFSSKPIRSISSVDLTHTGSEKFSSNKIENNNLDDSFKFKYEDSDVFINLWDLGGSRSNNEVNYFLVLYFEILFIFYILYL
jgi:hypothetical protein